MKTDDVERLLSSLSAPEPGPELHEKLLNAARARLQRTPSVAPRRSGDWGARIGLAASLLFCVLCLWTIGGPRREESPSVGATGTQEDVKQHIRGLGADDVSTREEAHRRLLKALGEDPRLISILKDQEKRESDPEVQARLQALLREAAALAQKTAELSLTRLQLTSHATLSVAGEETFLRAAFSPDGRFLAAITFGDHATLRLWSLPDLREIAARPVQQPSVFRSVIFSPDGKTVAVVGADAVALCDSLSLLQTRLLRPSGQNRIFHGFSFHPKGARAAYSEAEQGSLTHPSVDVVLVDREGTELRRIRRVDGALQYLQWSPEGQYLLADCHRDGYRGLVLNAESLREVGPINSPSSFSGADWCTAAAFMGDDRSVLTASLAELSVWSWKSGQQELRASIVFPGGATSICSGGPIFAASQASRLLVGVYLNSSAEIRTIRTFDKFDPNCMALSTDGRWLLITSVYQDTQAKLFSLKSD
jgi:hypothetical protein